uniref:uncharacterized protein n=1 Tax=Myxine glutinosa TaxID=7769 RepID=UPI00358E3DD3
MSNAWHFEPWLRSLDDFLLSVIGPLGPSTFSAIVTAHRPPGLLFLVVVVLAVLFVLCLSRCARSLLSWKSTEVEPDGRIWTSGPGDASVAGEAKKRRRRDKGSKTETPFAAEAKQKANGISTVTSGNCVVKTGLGQASRHPEDFLIGEKDHEKADIRPALHVRHAADADPSSIIQVCSPDMDVKIILLSNVHNISGRVDFHIGQEKPFRTVDLSLGFRCVGKYLCKSLIGMHMFTGCD